MGIKDYSDLNDIHMDVLRELGNIGSGNAATSLSSMLAKTVDISVPKISVLDYGQVAEQLGGPEMMCVGLMLSLSGDVEGMLMFLLQKDFTHLVLNALLGESLQDFSEINEMGLSAIKEIANIMAASYVNAISSMTGLAINITVPDICIDMVGAILSVPAIHYANISDQIIYIEDEFHSMEENLTSHILMIPDVNSLGKIMTNLGIEI
ncbi:MAG: chemotaxis protein CheC [Oscillospiraceae bacterium]|jgi:chemotaxis protein CheC|nr:chemotaxis protein CheC [Oscillospiraceae bacterium]